MKKLFPFTLLFFWTIYAFSQNQNYQVQLINQSFFPPENVDSWLNEEDNIRKGKITFQLIQFYNIPDAALREKMKSAGLELGDYIPNYVYEVSMNKDFDRSLLSTYGVRSILDFDRRFKLSPALYSGKLPSHIKKNGKLQVILTYHHWVPGEVALAEIKKYAKIISHDQRNHRLEVSFKETELPLITALRVVRYIEEVTPDPTLEATYWNSTGRTNWLNSGVNGLDYGGDGVTVAVHEGGIIDPAIHQEFQGRFTENGSGSISNHKTGVGNRIAGAGNLDPKNASIAREAHLLSLNNNNNNVSDFGGIDLRSVNHSFGYGVGTGGWSSGQNDDKDIHDGVGPIHTWSSGNKGGATSTYGPYAGIITGRANLTGGAKQGKNIFAVGATNSVDQLTGFSSRGPAFDGRIKPDLVIEGGGGTSHAAPKITGIVGQLVDAYRTINGGSDPHVALIKAALLNTCDDIENQGIDFTSGFGRTNVRRAFNTFNEGRHLSNNITNGGNNQHIISVPANVKQVRVLVHWPDYPASSSLPVKALVNDIDMRLTDPGNTVWEPWVLDHSPTLAAINSLATRQNDDLNNVEQITIDNPTAGNYTIDISGTLIPQGPQTYYLVYEFLYDELTLTYPIGNEHFVPGESEIIKWDSYGGTGTFNLDYSLDNGASWTNIAVGVNSAERNYTWTIPNVISGQAIVRISRGALSSQSMQNFHILKQPTGFQVLWACGGDVMLSWDALPEANNYRITRLGTKYMESIGTTSDTYFLATGMSTTQSEFFSVEALGATGSISRRVLAIEKPVGDINCSGLDVGIVESNYVSGYYSDCMSDVQVPVQAVIQNLGTVNASNITVKYQLNGGTIHSKTYFGTILPPQKQTVTFSQLPALNPGTNTLNIWTELAGDTNGSNDMLSVTIIEYGSGTETLPYAQNFDSWASCSTAWGCESISCAVEEDWFNVLNDPAPLGDNIDWRTDTGGTGTGSTGPSSDHTSGSGNYLYLEGSSEDGSGCQNKTAILNSPCFDLSGYSAVQLSFWYHMYGSSIGELHLDLLTENGLVTDVMNPVTGAQGNLWIEANVDLSPYLGQVVVLQFRGVTGNGYYTDIAIDDVSLSGTMSPIVANCKNVTVQLNTSGIASVTGSEINNGSTGAMPLNFSVSPSTFGCSEVGPNTVTLTVSDTYGNASTCTASVSVEDNLAPEIDTPCPSNIVLCGAQNVSWTPPTATDNCGVTSTNSNYAPGGLFGEGNYDVMYTFSDAGGQSVSCNFSITIHPLPVVTIIQADIPQWCQGVKELSADVSNMGALESPVTFSWSGGLGNAQQITAMTNGIYSVTVTDGNNCSSVAMVELDVDLSTFLSAHTIIAGEGLEMSESTVLTGGVGVLDADEVTIQNNSNITTFLRSSSAGIDGSSTVADYFSSDSPITLPPFIANPYNDNNNITVPSGGSMTLSGSNYGDVKVGKNATLIIDNETIYLRSLTINTASSILFNQSTNLMVKKKLNIGMLCTVNAGGPSTVIYVGDNASVKQGSTVEANIYALEELEVNDSGAFLTTYMNGLFIGNDGVLSDDNVIWGWNLNCDALPGSLPFASPNLEGTVEGISPKEASMRIFPNPVKAVLKIELTMPTEMPAKVEIVDINGRAIYRTQHEFESPKWQLDLNPINLPSGIYLLNIRTKDGVMSKRFVKE